MDLPIVHPTAIRFYLEKIGINPKDEHSVVLGYGCLRLLEHVVKSRDWRFPHAAYQNERNQRVLSELFSEIVQEIDSLFESPDFWAIFNNTYEHAIKLSFPDFMAISDARRRANNKWLQEKVESITFRVPKGKKN